ncbi:MAG: ABC transporter permease [Candidatus Bathyarchaeota archaeon]|nr:ABC transporter permease [Candidatus Bathyarchaeota archaeon]
MKLKTSLGRLTILELEQYWSFPVFEIVLFTALLAIQNVASTRINSYVRDGGLIYLILITATIVSRSFAGSIGRREIKTLLSYPIKRWEILLAKFITNLLIVFGILAFVVFLNIPLLGLDLFNIEIYILIAILFIQLFYLCTIATTISAVVKNEALSIFVFIFLLFGLEFSLGPSEAPYKYFTLFKGNEVMFGYITFLLRPPQSPFGFVEPPFTFQEFTTALGYPLLTSVILLIILLIYFQWIMQID